MIRTRSLSRTLKDKVTAIIAGDYSYIESRHFSRPSIGEELFRDSMPGLPSAEWYRPTLDPEENKYRVTKMTDDEERMMFLRLNYAKKRLCSLLKDIDKRIITAQYAAQIISWYRKIKYCTEYIARMNLALVLAMEKRYPTRAYAEYDERIGEGNTALLKAIDKFNVDRGFKFSTYACRAILQHWTRLDGKNAKKRKVFATEFDPEMQKSDWPERKAEIALQENVMELRHILGRNLAELNPVEMTVLRRRYNLDEACPSAMTLDEIGRIIGVTKERVRQIQVKAIQKLRTYMKEEDDELCVARS